MPKSKAEGYKEVILAAIEDETETEAIADAAKAAKDICVFEQRVVKAEELSDLVEKTLEGSGESFRLRFDDDSNLYLSTKGGILTATVSN
jgi:hypothetical protein